MPSAAQVRRERLDQLYREFNGKNVTIIDPIYRRALELFPYITPQTAKDYAEACLRMLTKKRE